MTAAIIPPIAPPDKPEDGLASDVSAAEDAELVAAGVMLVVGVELVKDEVRLVAPGKLVGMDEENELMFDAAFVVVVVCFVLVGFFVVVDLLVDAG
jgi:azurin